MQRWFGYFYLCQIVLYVSGQSGILLLKRVGNISHVGQIDQIDHDLDHLDPNLPL